MIVWDAPVGNTSKPYQLSSAWRPYCPTLALEGRNGAVQTLEDSKRATLAFIVHG
jgi:hypothetical protein